jgi:hypothetical protein
VDNLVSNHTEKLKVYRNQICIGSEIYHSHKWYS